MGGRHRRNLLQNISHVVIPNFGQTTIYLHRLEQRDHSTQASRREVRASRDGMESKLQSRRAIG